MKFLCPSCKAKYQIADEKVLGRSVRMKCRKCGFVIPISEVPPAPPSMLPGASDGGLPAVPKAPAPAVVKPSAARTPPSPATRDSRVPPPRDPSAERRRPTLAELKSPAPGAPPAARHVPPPKPAPRAASAALTPPAAAGAQPKPAPVPDLLSALDEEEDQGTRISSGGALAAAFGALVTEEKAPAVGKEDAGMPADEWFVAINDVPVGPIRLGEIRKRAMLGAITRDSLVWRDGHETWRPLSAYPELVAVLEESMSSVQASALPLVPSAGRPASEALSPSSGGVTSTVVVTDEFHLPGVAKTRMPVLGWIAIFVALAFGLVIGFVVFNKQKPPETVYKYVEVAPKTDQPIAAAAQGADQGGAPDPLASGKPRPSRPSGSKATNTSSDKGTNGEGLAGLKGLSGLSPGGPGSPGSTPGSTAPAGGGGQLDASQIQGTVSRYTGAVKRRCWQPALDGRDPSAPSTARVVVTIGVGGSGSVNSVSTSGDPRGYPGLSNCIASSVRAWQFPATGSSSTAVVPFVFAAQ